MLVWSSLGISLEMAEEQEQECHVEGEEKQEEGDGWSVQMSRMVVKMNQPARKKPKALLKSLTPTVVVAVDVYAAPMPKPGVRTQPMAIQKPPYEERAVAPKVFPTAISLFSRINMEINRWGTESYVPHASEQLNETSISESQCCDDIWLCDIPVLNVNQR
jgi:hypothetical protein